MNRRRWMAATAAVSVLVLVWLLASAWRTIRSTQTSPITAPVAEAPEAPSAEEPAADDAPAKQTVAKAPTAPATPEEEEPAMAWVPENLSVRAAADYRKRARLPPFNEAIAENVDPVRRDREVTPKRVTGSDGSEPALVVWPEAISFEAPGPVVIHAMLVEDDVAVPAERIVVNLVHELRGSVLTAVATDDGGTGDAAAGDYVYTLAWEPTGEDIREYRGSYLASVAALPDGADEERVISTGFLLSVPDSRLTGRFREEAVGGSLFIEAEVEVERPGRFHLEGSLFSSDGTGIVWAQTAAELDEGRHWMPLEFYGLAIRESGIDGPYVLASAALSTTSEMPNQKNEVLYNAYTTTRYSATQFSDEPFDDPDLIQAAERLEAEGEGLIQPEATP
jgi:hypothetical protein